MDYKTLMGYQKKKNPTKKQSKPKVNKVLEGIKEDLNEWIDKTFRNAPKRWSGSGLTEFEQQGGKDFIKEGPAYEYRKPLKRLKEILNLYLYIF